ncbi:MAG: valine--tRNA ligase [Acidimicrobiia bacterium]
MPEPADAPETPAALGATGPEVDFPKAYRPDRAQERWYDVWEAAGAFAPEVNPDGDPFCIVIPPPNVTGSLHMGHAFEHSLIDATIRRKRMQGFAALWVPGTDHAGIATQNVVERELVAEGTDRHELGREAFEQRVWDWKARSGGRITEQMRTMGLSCDWARERFTLDDGLSRAVRVVFVRLYEEGLVYRANRIINWCPRCHTALSDIEVEHRDVAGELVTISYPFTDGSGSVQVATTRAETMLGDTAVAVNPDDDRYTDAVGRTLMLPLVGREIPVVADDAVDPSFGTGAVKVTPAHDPNDFEIAQRHDLPAVTIFTREAVVNSDGGDFEGQDRFEARSAVKEALRDAGELISVEEYDHSVGHCYRCHNVVEPRLSLQWFVKVGPLAAPALDAVRDHRTQFIPTRWEKLYVDWMENLRDWCVSRQIWWGHRIPAWYCNDCSEVIVTTEDPASCPSCAGRDLHQDDDVLDTWFSSALWPFTTLGWPEQTDDLERFYPNAMLHTGFDIIYFWVARMMQMGLHFAGDVPFRHVAIHGLVRDAEGRKMSKSTGNAVDPLELADRFGVDALRFALVRAGSPGQDVPLAEEWVEGARNFVNKLWNASRFLSMNLDGRPLAELATDDASELLDGASVPERWIISRLEQTVARVNESFERYDFADGVRELQHFTRDEFCDWFIELSKVPLADAQQRERTQRILGTGLSAVLRLLHPVVPFVTEELWHRLGGDGTVITASFPAEGIGVVDPDADTAMGVVIEVVSAVRRFRSEHNVSPAKRFTAFVHPAGPAEAGAIRALKPAVEALGGLGELVIDVEERPARTGEQRIVADGADVVIPFEGLIDLEAARSQLDRQMEKLDKEKSQVEKKLANESFVERAPADVVAAQRARLVEVTESLDALRAQRASLG